MESTTNPEGAAPKRADAVANHQRLLEAAREAFAELGANAEVKDIAERAGVGVGTIYRHFASKEVLLREVILEAKAEFERGVATHVRSGDPIEALRHFLVGLLTVTENYGWLFDAVVGGNLPESVREGLDEDNPELQLITILEQGAEAGILDGGIDLPVATNMLLGFALTWKYGELKQTMTRDEAVERTLRLFLHGAARRN